MEIKFNFVLLDELKERPSVNAAETHIAIIREYKDPGSVLQDNAADFDSLEST